MQWPVFPYYTTTKDVDDVLEKPFAASGTWSFTAYPRKISVIPGAPINSGYGIYQDGFWVQFYSQQTPVIGEKKDFTVSERLRLSVDDNPGWNLVTRLTHKPAAASHCEWYLEADTSKPMTVVVGSNYNDATFDVRSETELGVKPLVRLQANIDASCVVTDVDTAAVKLSYDPINSGVKSYAVAWRRAFTNSWFGALSHSLVTYQPRAGWSAAVLLRGKCPYSNVAFRLTPGGEAVTLEAGFTHRREVLSKPVQVNVMTALNTVAPRAALSLMVDITSRWRLSVTSRMSKSECPIHVAGLHIEDIS